MTYLPARQRAFNVSKGGGFTGSLEELSDVQGFLHSRPMLLRKSAIEGRDVQVPPPGDPRMH